MIKTVGELIKKLQKYPEDAHIAISQEGVYGDLDVVSIRTLDFGSYSIVFITTSKPPFYCCRCGWSNFDDNG